VARRTLRNRTRRIALTALATGLTAAAVLAPTAPTEAAPESVEAAVDATSHDREWSRSAKAAAERAREKRAAAAAARAARKSPAPAAPTTAAAAPVTAATPATSSGSVATTSGGPFIPYSGDSFFRKPLPTSGVPVASNSAAGIAFANANDKYAYPRIRGVQGDPWGEPFQLSDCSDPIWRLTGDVPPELAYLKTEGFHAEAGFSARTTGTSDSPMTVIDTCGVPSMKNGHTVWLFRATPGGAGTINVAAAGAMDNASNGLDRRNPRSTSSKNFTQNRGNILGAETIRDDLLAYALKGGNGGTLGHVLEMFWLETDAAAGFVHPMVNFEKGKSGWGAEGMRLRVKESWKAPAGCTGPGLVIAKTLQRYGSYLGDNSGSGSGIKAEQGSTFPGLTKDALGPCVTWDDMEFVQPGWEG
jgi:hypothetical protein